VPFPLCGISNLTNRVYKTGFATNQQAYEENVVPLFKSLDRLEKILQNQRYLIGDTLTEAGKFRSKLMLIP
jgi:glutathionyl-hydroquinone reductase